MRLPLSTWPDIEAWLQRSKTIVIPVGSMEQHGPNGSISDAVRYRRDFPDGRIGSDPTQANAADGGRIVALAAQCLLEDLARCGSG